MEETTATAKGFGVSATIDSVSSPPIKENIQKSTINTVMPEPYEKENIELPAIRKSS